MRRPALAPEERHVARLPGLRLVLKSGAATPRAPSRLVWPVVTQLVTDSRGQPGAPVRGSPTMSLLVVGSAGWTRAHRMSGSGPESPARWVVVSTTMLRSIIRFSGNQARSSALLVGVRCDLEADSASAMLSPASPVPRNDPPGKGQRIGSSPELTGYCLPLQRRGLGRRRDGSERARRWQERPGIEVPVTRNWRTAAFGRSEADIPGMRA